MSKREIVETTGGPVDVLDAYRAPGDEDQSHCGEQETPEEELPFYVVTPVGLVLFHWMTLGIYTCYWMFQQWRYYRRYSGENVSPFWRMVFHVFFAHALFSRMSRVAGERVPDHPAPSLSEWATVWVLLRIVSSVFNRVTSESDDLTLSLTGGGIEMVSAVPLVLAQRVANRAAGDPDSSRRRLFDPYSLVGLCLLSMFWGAVALGSLAD